MPEAASKRLIQFRYFSLTFYEKCDRVYTARTDLSLRRLSGKRTLPAFRKIVFHTAIERNLIKMQRKRFQSAGRVSALTLALCLALSGFSGCGSDKKTEKAAEESVEMSDMEYGATMREDSSLDVPIEYDKRYLNEDELKVLAQYYSAIQNEDTDALAACTVDFYMDYYLDNAYGGLLDASAFLAQQHETLQKTIENGTDVTIQKIYVSDCKRQEEAGSSIEYLQNMFNELEGDDYCDQHWKDCKTLTVQPVMTDGTNYAEADEANIFLVNLDGSYYVCA